MYIFIFEDGSVSKDSVLSEGEKKSSDDGYLTILDISDPEQPLIYLDEGWTDVDVVSW